MESFPSLILPMMAVAGPQPTNPDAFAAELKWDGVRVIAHVRDGAVRLVSRNGRDVSESYPDLAALGELLDEPAVLDGEIVAFDQAGRPNFGTLQARMHVRQPSQRLLASVPVFYQVFDVLHVAGWSTLRMPYQQRRDLLDQLDLDGPRVQVPPCFPGGGASVLDSARQQGLEGVVSKRLDAPYLPGRRSDLWRKTKITAMQEVVIGRVEARRRPPGRDDRLPAAGRSRRAWPASLCRWRGHRLHRGHAARPGEPAAATEPNQ